jgi:hypothetical protein
MQNCDPLTRYGIKEASLSFNRIVYFGTGS